MAAFHPIIANLEYETGDYRELKLDNADISATLLRCLEKDEWVEGLAAEPSDWEYFSEVIADDSSINEEGHQFRLPADFDFFAKLLEATDGRYGSTDLLAMWLGWKAEALSAGILESKIASVAGAISKSMHNQISCNAFITPEDGLRTMFATLLQQPGGLAALEAELSTGDYSPIEAMKLLGKIQA